MDPDPGGPKPYGSGTGTLFKTVQVVGHLMFTLMRVGGRGGGTRRGSRDTPSHTAPPLPVAGSLAGSPSTNECQSIIIFDIKYEFTTNNNTYEIYISKNHAYAELEKIYLNMVI